MTAHNTTVYMVADLRTTILFLFSALSRHSCYLQPDIKCKPQAVYQHWSRNRRSVKYVRRTGLLRLRARPSLRSLEEKCCFEYEWEGGLACWDQASSDRGEDGAHLSSAPEIPLKLCATSLKWDGVTRSFLIKGLLFARRFSTNRSSKYLHLAWVNTLNI